MKKMILLGIFLMLSWGVAAQSYYNVSDLMYFINYYNVDKLVEELEEYDYEYYETEHDAENDLNYISYDHVDDVFNFRSMIIHEDLRVDDENIYALEYRTSIKDEFNELRDELERHDFVRVDSGEDADYGEYEAYGEDFETDYYVELYKEEMTEFGIYVYGIYIVSFFDD